MKHAYSFLLAGLVLFASCLPGCKTNPGGIGDSEQISELLAPEASNTYLTIADFNFYEQGDSIFTVGLVDNQGDRNCRPLIAVEFFDANNNLLPLKGTYFKFTDTVYAFNREMPARGRTSFMHKFPKKRIVGTYTQVRARPIGADLTDRKTAVIFENQGFYKQLESVKGETSQIQVEKAWVGSGFVLNPFDFGVSKPYFELWVYGKDKKLYVSKLLDPDLHKDQVMMNATGPMAPKERRPVTMKVIVESMPKILRDTGIGRIDVQAFQ